MEQSGVRPSVRPSVRPFVYHSPQQRPAADLLLSAVRQDIAPLKPRQSGALQILYCIVLYISIDGDEALSAAARRRSPALSSKRGQCHIDSRVDKANIDLLKIFLHVKRNRSPNFHKNMAI